MLGNKEGQDSEKRLVGRHCLVWGTRARVTRFMEVSKDDTGVLFRVEDRDQRGRSKKEEKQLACT